MVDDDKKIDLARLLINIYGVGYIGHPRSKICWRKNNIKPLDLMVEEPSARAIDCTDPWH
ncbi:MAG: hypothetical protein ACREH6_01920 [Geminicoccaceae bacterium]